jgi:hypothetical protein
MRTQIYLEASRYSVCDIPPCESNDSHFYFTVLVLFFIAVCVSLMIEIIKNRNNGQQ